MQNNVRKQPQMHENGRKAYRTHLSQTGQIMVKYWSNNGQILVKPTTGQKPAGQTQLVRPNWSKVI
jgi:hypothetical protein